MFPLAGSQQKTLRHFFPFRAARNLQRIVEEFHETCFNVDFSSKISGDAFPLVERDWTWV